MKDGTEILSSVRVDNEEGAEINLFVPCSEIKTIKVKWKSLKLQMSNDETKFKKIELNSNDITSKRKAFNHDKGTKVSSEGQLKTKYFSFTKELNDTNEHTVKIEMIAQDETKNSPLVWNFKLKNDGEKPITPFDGSSGRVYIAEKYLKLPTNGEFQEYIIRMHPKDTTKYKVTDFICFLKGTKVSEDNASFYMWDDAPYIWHDKLVGATGEAKRVTELGLKSAMINIKTMSPRSRVKYRFVGLNGETLTMPGDAKPIEKEMQNDGTGGNTANLTFYQDVPTKMEAWVVAENGDTDSIFGKYTRTYTNLPVIFSYKKPNNANELEEKAYNEIVVDKEKVKNDKIYVGFGIYNINSLKPYEYTYDANYQYPAYQKKPEKLEETTRYIWHKTEVNVADLTATTPLEIVIPITSKGVLSFTYKIKVTAK